MVVSNFLIQKAKQSPGNSGKLTGAGMHTASIDPAARLGPARPPAAPQRTAPPQRRIPARLRRRRIQLEKYPEVKMQLQTAVRCCDSNITLP